MEALRFNRDDWLGGRFLGGNVHVNVDAEGNLKRQWEGFVAQIV